MSRRPLLILAAVVAAAAPATASARPADFPVTTAPAAADSTLPLVVAAADSARPPAIHADSSGSDSGTLTVLAVAGGTLLLGIGAGFQGGRLSGRRQIIGS